MPETKTHSPGSAVLSADLQGAIVLSPTPEHLMMGTGMIDEDDAFQKADVQMLTWKQAALLYENLGKLLFERGYSQEEMNRGDWPADEEGGR